jgi:hypothetical protein
MPLGYNVAAYWHDKSLHEVKWMLHVTTFVNTYTLSVALCVQLHYLRDQ